MKKSRRTPTTRRRTSTRSSSTGCWRMPQYGERWGRHWLDVVRYGEDNPGNITNPPYPHAWRYRDWVIEALNKDVPYDRFVKLQLAADLMPGTSRPDMRALGIIALGPQDHKDVRLSVDVVGTLQLNDWDERLDTVSRGLLGLSVACARCHDHKFDPIRQMDYARLTSVFASTSRALRPFFEIDPKTETRFMWVYQRMFDLHYTANLLESDPGSKPEQAERQVKKFRDGARRSCRPRSTRCRRSIRRLRSTSRRCRIRARSRRKQRNPDGTLKKREPVPDEKRARPADQIPNPERAQQSAGRRRRTAEADRSEGAVPELGLRRGRRVRIRRSPISRSSTPRRACRAICRCIAAAISERPAIRRRAGSRSCWRRAPADFHERIGPARAWRENLHRRRAAERARDRESRVGLAFRQAPGRHAERLRHSGAAADASGAARGSVGAIHRERLVAEVAAPRDHAVGDLSAVEPAARARDGGRSDEPVPVADESAAHGHRGVSRFAAAGLGQARSHAVRSVRRHRRGHAAHRVCDDQPRPQQRRRHEAVRRAGADGPHSDAAADAQPAAGAVCDEQRVRAGAGGGAGRAGRERKRRPKRRFRRSTGRCSRETRPPKKWRSA